MSNCENFKRPRQLGLSIYTSDVSLYDGENLDCVTIPDNASLNDVIEAFGDKFCTLIELINNASTPLVPNDPWVELDETDMVSVLWNGSATHNSTSIDMFYKILNVDTVLVRCHVVCNVDITALDNNINNNFRFSPFTGSNWFGGSKLFVPSVQRVPISIYTTTPTSDVPRQIGNAVHSVAGGNNLISIAETEPQMSNGTYDFVFDFEFHAQLV